MPEASQITFSYKEVVEALVKKHGLQEGIWGLFVKFGIQGSNIGPTESDIKPAAIVPILELGLQKMDKESTIAVDAAKVNPKPRTGRHN